MLKFTGIGKDGDLYFFGLSRGNIDRLIAGQPIRVNLSEMGGPNINVVILFGETERILFNDLKRQKLVPDDMEYREAEIGTREYTREKKDEPWPDFEGK